MIELIIAAIVIIAILLFYIFFVFKNIIRKLNENTKKYFVEKLQSYDEVIDQKKEEIRNLDEEIKKRESKIQVISGNLLENMNDDEIEEEKSNKKQYDATENEIIATIIRNPTYREEKFFDTYRSVKKMFNLNIEKTIKEFIKTYVDSSEQKDYEKLKKLLGYFDTNTTYECLTLKNTEQYDVVKSILKKREIELLGFDKIEREKFDLNKFIELIKCKMKEIDPTIIIYVGSKDENYDYLSEYIKTEVYTKMIEGVMISYKGKIYDYSI